MFLNQTPRWLKGSPQSMESECGRRRDGAFSSSLQPSLVHNDWGECDRDQNSRESSRDPDTSLLFTQPVVEGNRYFLHNIIDRTVCAFVPCTSVVHAPESNSSVAQGKPQSMERVAVTLTPACSLHNLCLKVKRKLLLYC